MRRAARRAASLAAIATALTLGLSACGGGADLPDGAVAQVGDSVISSEELQRSLDQQQASTEQQGGMFPAEDSEEFEDLRRQALDALFIQRVVSFEARSCGEPCTVTDEQVTEQLEMVKETNFEGSDEDFQTFLDDSELTMEDARQLLRSGLEEEALFEHVTRGVRFTAQQARTYYDENRTEFQVPASREASHILVETEAEANRLAARVTPANFARLAEANSTDPGSAAQGGSLGAIQRGALVPEFEEVAFGLANGVISDPVQTQFGWHIITVQVEPENTIGFEEAREGIVQAQLQAERQEEFTDWRDEVIQKWRDRTTYADSDLEPPEPEEATEPEVVTAPPATPTPTP